VVELTNHYSIDYKIKI